MTYPATVGLWAMSACGVLVLLIWIWADRRDRRGRRDIVPSAVKLREARLAAWNEYHAVQGCRVRVTHGDKVTEFPACLAEVAPSGTLYVFTLTEPFTFGTEVKCFKEFKDVFAPNQWRTFENSPALYKSRLHGRLT